jgi:large subunit ribosomal protein L10
LFAIGASMSVIKKRLLKFVFEKEGIEFDPKQFTGQSGIVFSPKDMVETAGAVYQFSKINKLLKIHGGFEVGDKRFVSAGDVTRIGQLPSKEVLLGQLVYMLGTPIRSFMVVLNEKSKKTN